MKFDMHCHTREGSLDGKVEIDAYIQKLKNLGYGGMLVCDHDSYDGYRQWRSTIKGRKYEDFVVLKGIEYDTKDCGHMIVIMPVGIRLKVLEMRGMPVRRLIQIVHKNGGIIGPAHPFGVPYQSMVQTSMRRKKRWAQLGSLMNDFDFVEIFNSCERIESNEHAARMAAKYHKPGFGGSDGHKFDGIGLAYTDLPDSIVDEDALIEYVRSVDYIRCGGKLNHRTIKEKIGRLNWVLVQGFHLYNNFAGWVLGTIRRQELRRLRRDDDIQIK